MSKKSRYFVKAFIVRLFHFIFGVVAAANKTIYRNKRHQDDRHMVGIVLVYLMLFQIWSRKEVQSPTSKKSKSIVFFVALSVQ